MANILFLILSTFNFINHAYVNMTLLFVEKMEEAEEEALFNDLSLEV